MPIAPPNIAVLTRADQQGRGLGLDLCIGIFGNGWGSIGRRGLLLILLFAGLGIGQKAAAQIRTGLPMGRAIAPQSYYQVYQPSAASVGYRSKAATRANGGAKQAKSRPNLGPLRTLVTQRDTLQMDPRYGFYDDFANSRYYVDTTKWVRRGGTFVNNTYGVNQPNFQVATFDGLSAGGTPYDSVRVGIAGYCDTLTCLPIDLISIPIPQVDSLFLSFDYQAGGPAVQLMPELFDSLNLYYKRPRDTTWTQVWHTLGDTFPTKGATAFKHVVLPVSVDWQEYGFQFRFVNYGSRNGTGDVFNVDNVYLNYGRDTLDSGGSRRFRDIAAITASPYLFYPYTAIPRKHFANGLCPTNLRDTLKTTFGNQNNYTSTAQEVPYTIRATITDSASGRELERVEDPLVLTSEFPGLGYFNFLRPFRVPEARVEIGLPTSGLDSLKAFLARPAVDTGQTSLVTTFTLPDQDPQNNPYRLNDTISTVTSLSNYYAYDDGSAELIRWTGGNNARMAQQFSLCTRDSLRAIKMLFPKTLQNVFPGRTITFNLYVWPRLLPVRTNIPDRFYINIGVNITPAMMRNGYTTIPFARPVMIDTGTYYIGWQQGVGIENEVRVGVDLDTEPGNKIWYNFNGNWQLDTTDKHPLCIRPVFGRRARVITDLATQDQPTKLTAYPNPVDLGAGQISLTGTWASATWHDLSGRVLAVVINDNASQSVRMPAGLRPGIYLLTVRPMGGNSGQSSQTLRVIVR